MVQVTNLNQHSSVSRRKDFFLILDNQRIFGFDNLGGWHQHPYKNPLTHQPCAELSEGEVLEKIKEVVNRLGK